MLVPETWTPIKRLSIERAAGCFLVSWKFSLQLRDNDFQRSVEIKEKKENNTKKQ